MVNKKFKVGDEVVVIKVDEEMTKEPYDGIGDEYASLLFQYGTIVDYRHDRENEYTVKFEDRYFDEWYFKDTEIVSKEHYEKYHKKAIEVLYGKNK